MSLLKVLHYYYAMVYKSTNTWGKTYSSNY